MPDSVQTALVRAQQAGLARLDSQILLAHLLQHPRSWLHAHADVHLSPAQCAAFAQLCTRRAQGEPIAYLLGEWEFYGHRLQVTPGVLVPRPDTETLVEWAMTHLADLALPRPRVIDLGTGSGAIAISLACAFPHAEVVATDLSAQALAVARQNIARLAPNIQTLQGSWWQALPADARFDLAVSNPPYIAGDDSHLDALQHEPRMALTPEGDGLSAIRSLIHHAGAHLRPGAWLLIEHGWDQAAPVSSLFEAAGYRRIETRQDVDGRDRCTGAQRLA